ncbi:MAG: hypothetical protein ACRD3T_09540 [Terriglobia bacterium]
MASAFGQYATVPRDCQGRPPRYSFHLKKVSRATDEGKPGSGVAVEYQGGEVLEMFPAYEKAPKATAQPHPQH